MKKLSLLFLLFATLYSIGQTAPAARPTNKTNAGKYGQAVVQNLTSSMKSDTCLDKKFSIVFYLVQDSLYSLPTNTTAMASYSLPLVMSILNNAFSRICVSFENCKTVIIPHHPYNEWKAMVGGSQVVSTWFHDSTINVYLPETFVPFFPDDPEVSYSYAPGTGTQVTRNAIVCEKRWAWDTNQVGFRGSSLLHAFGHFFGLPHTFAEINPTLPVQFPPVSPVVTMEYAEHNNMQNCHDHGDGFCDTEADPFPAGGGGPVSNANCAGTALKDGQGLYYVLPADNIMSIYGCRCRFSNEQYQYMARYILAHRMYLH